MWRGHNREYVPESNAGARGMKHRASVFVLFVLACMGASVSAAPSLLERVAAAPNDPNVFAVMSQNRLWTTVDGGAAFDVVVIHPSRIDIDEDRVDSPALSMAPNAAPAENRAATTQTEGESLTASPLDLAISDSGSWVVVYPNVVCLQGSSSHGYRCLEDDNLIGATFDRHNNLWVGAKDRLIRYKRADDAMARYAIPLSRSCRAIFPGPGATEVTVLMNTGFASFEMGADGLVQRSRYMASNLDTLFPVSSRDRTRRIRWYTAVGGVLFAFSRDGRRTKIERLPGRARSLLVNELNEIAYKLEDGVWHLLADGTDTTLDATDMALLADGRLIGVGAVGIEFYRHSRKTARPTLSAAGSNGHREKAIDTVDSRQMNAASCLMLTPATPPPSCSRRSTYLPDIGVRVSKHYGQHRAIHDPGGRVSDWRFRIELSWPIEAPPSVACVKQWTRHRKQEADRRRKCSALIRAALTGPVDPERTDIIRAIDHRLSRERLSAIVKIIRND